MVAQDWEERRVCYSWSESKHFNIQGSYRWMSRAMNSHTPRMPHDLVPLQGSVESAILPCGSSLAPGSSLVPGSSQGRS